MARSKKSKKTKKTNKSKTTKKKLSRVRKKARAVKMKKRTPKKAARKVTKKMAVAPEASTPAPPEVLSLMPREGDPAPDFRVSTDDGNVASLGDFRGRKVVLYFYPKDDTPGCTREACSFRDGISRIQAKGAAVLGVSADSVESHQKFKEKYSLNFPLLSDADKKLVQAYGVWKEKNMYGRTYMGIERTTFLINEEGRIQRIFPKVNVEVHYDEVLQALG